jgi:hypothetical protein
MPLSINRKINSEPIFFNSSKKAMKKNEIISALGSKMGQMKKKYIFI